MTWRILDKSILVSSKSSYMSEQGHTRCGAERRTPGHHSGVADVFGLFANQNSFKR